MHAGYGDSRPNRRSTATLSRTHFCQTHSPHSLDSVHPGVASHCREGGRRNALEIRSPASEAACKVSWHGQQDVREGGSGCIVHFARHLQFRPTLHSPVHTVLSTAGIRIRPRTKGARRRGEGPATASSQAEAVLSALSRYGRRDDETTMIRLLKLSKRLWWRPTFLPYAWECSLPASRLEAANNHSGGLTTFTTARLIATGPRRMEGSGTLFLYHDAALPARSEGGGALAALSAICWNLDSLSNDLWGSVPLGPPGVVGISYRLRGESEGTPLPHVCTPYCTGRCTPSDQPGAPGDDPATGSLYHPLAVCGRVGAGIGDLPQ